MPQDQGFLPGGGAKLVDSHREQRKTG